MVCLTSVSNEELVNAGVLAYKTRDFQTAIKCLLEATDLDPRHWRGKLYLAMSYYNTNDLLAVGLFRHLKEDCTDAGIRQKAETALTALKSETKGKMPKMTCTIMKPKRPAPYGEDAVDVEWEAMNPSLRQYT